MMMMMMMTLTQSIGLCDPHADYIIDHWVAGRNCRNSCVLRVINRQQFLPRDACSAKRVVARPSIRQSGCPSVCDVDAPWAYVLD